MSRKRSVAKAPLSWNRIPRVAPACVVPVQDRFTPIAEELPRPLIAYGNGRSYGDVCLGKGSMLLTRGLDRFLHFDSEAGVLRCEAGVTLAEILDLVLPQGWFLPVTPGTRFVTVGGAVANDVHGKNHHVAGSFGHHVRALELLRSDGNTVQCGPGREESWFRATVGGLGLTGLIRWVDIQLLPMSNPWMWVSSRRFTNLDEFWQLNHEAEVSWPYTVAWIDCLARGRVRGRDILFAGQHAAPQSALPQVKHKHRQVPLEMPFSLVNSLSLRTFNAMYYRQPVQPEGALVHYAPYFYPLDAIENWNRIYGRKGFFQYQCVLPPCNAEAATADLLEAIGRSGEGSFLAVLKTFGDRHAAGMLSFPRPGATLALDFPDRGAKTRALFERLDWIVREAGGALYPGKDARMPADMFRVGFPEWEAFSAYVDPAFCSRFWARVSK